MSRIKPTHTTSGRLKNILVKADRNWNVDPPKKSFHGDVDLRRYLNGNSHTKHGRERDSRRQKLYDAERDVRGKTSFGADKEFDSLEETAKWVQKMLGSAWWQRRYKMTSVFLRPGYWARRGIARSGSLSASKIILPKRSRNSWTISHELVHLTVENPHAGHGRLFCARLLEIIGAVYGDSFRDDLKEAYRTHNVKWHPRRSVPEKYKSSEYA